MSLKRGLWAGIAAAGMLAVGPFAVAEAVAAPPAAHQTLSPTAVYKYKVGTYTDIFSCNQGGQAGVNRGQWTNWECRYAGGPYWELWVWDVR